MPREYLRADEKYEDFSVGSERSSEDDDEDTWSDMEIRQMVNYLRSLKAVQKASACRDTCSHSAHPKSINQHIDTSCNKSRVNINKKAAETQQKLTKNASSNEAVHLQQKLRNLSSELVTLRNRLHVTNSQCPTPYNNNNITNSCHNLANTNDEVNGGPEVHGEERIYETSATNQSVRLREAKCQGSRVIRNSVYTDTEDLIHLTGLVTEDAVIKALQARFYNQEYFTNVGPILLSVNPCQDLRNPLTLTSANGSAQCPQLLRVVHEAVRQQSETGYPQAIILSGESGSGKTYSSMILLRQLFDVAGGGPETDAYKHLAAAFTVLRSLGSAKTSSNSESSRIGHFLEVQVTDGALYRTKIHCYFLDQTRVVKPLTGERNYHIFYQMLAGLNQEERVKLNLEGYSIHKLRYLSRGDIGSNDKEEALRFESWKTCLSVLGIPFMDVVRVLAAVLLLGNVQFVEGQGLEVEMKGNNEIKAVASLLGVSSLALFKGLTTRTHNVRGQLVKSMCDVNMSNMTRDALAKALYCRTVATIVRRANSLKRLGPTSGTLSSDSNESMHNHHEVSSQHASTVGSSSAKSSKSMSVLNSAVRHATDGFIGILDMFGFEDAKPCRLEQLCINLCAETMQHFYNTHIFKSSIESCRDEGIHCDIEVDYVDNVPCIDLISSLRTGLLSLLDAECSTRGKPESYIQKIKIQHRQNLRLFEPSRSQTADPRTFGICHFASKVVYDATDFLETNQDTFPDDIVAVFHKQTCHFGFATHLFGSEIKALFSNDKVPRGVLFRISPTVHSDLHNGDEPVSTLTQDFHTRLDNLLRTLVHAKPHFIRCIRANKVEMPMQFDREDVMSQIRALQVLETVTLMAGGFPHRMRSKAFNSRYRLLVHSEKLKRTEEKANEDCKIILEMFVKMLNEGVRRPNVTCNWAMGKRHIFLSEGARQQLEMLRVERRNRAAVLIQSLWKGWHLRRRWPALKRTFEQRTRNSSGTGLSCRPRPQPIAGTPPPDMEKCDQKAIQPTYSIFGLDPERPPPVPPSRPYTVSGNTKLGYPQTRVMKMTFKDEANPEAHLLQGSVVVVVGTSPKRGHLVVEHKSLNIHVPYQFMEIRTGSGGGNLLSLANTSKSNCTLNSTANNPGGIDI